jgi:hypothetical protein
MIHLLIPFFEHLTHKGPICKSKWEGRGNRKCEKIQFDNEGLHGQELSGTKCSVLTNLTERSGVISTLEGVHRSAYYWEGQ